jgi:hypothetical protein
MTFAKWVYRIAAVYGLLAVLPMYFTERKFGIDNPPAVTHPELYYGFVGLCVVWQLAFLLISTDPERYRPLMPITVGEKLVFFVPVVILYATGRLGGTMVAAGCIDGVLGVLFAIAWWRTRPKSEPNPRPRAA